MGMVLRLGSDKLAGLGHIGGGLYPPCFFGLCRVLILGEYIFCDIAGESLVKPCSPLSSQYMAVR